MTAVRRPTEEILSVDIRASIDHWTAKYPPEEKQSAVIAALHIVQECHGWLNTELMDAVAKYLSMEPISVYEIATFYTMYNLKPVGKHKISVCTNISCMLRGAEEIMKYLEDKLGIKRGGTTSDGKFTLKEAECLAACGGAPMFILDKQYHENLTPAKIDDILASIE